jgi:anti-anti-sigma factor
VALSISTQRVHAGIGQLALIGEIDLSTTEALLEAITTELKRDDVAAVVVDLDAVGFLDSTGIGVLVEGRRRADVLGKGYRIGNAHGMVRYVLDLTGAWDHLAGEPNPSGEPNPPGDASEPGNPS